MIDVRKKVAAILMNEGFSYERHFSLRDIVDIFGGNIPKDTTEDEVTAVYDDLAGNIAGVRHLYRGMYMAPDQFANLKPGMPLGRHWTIELPVARDFAIPSSRFPDRTLSVVFEIAPVQLEQIYTLFTVGARISSWEDEICLEKRTPITITGVWTNNQKIEDHPLIGVQMTSGNADTW